MPVFELNQSIQFPPPFLAESDGLIAIGGDLTQERLINAYQHGIFPWYSEDEPILWYSPDPRFVLFPANLKVSKSMKQFLQKSNLEFKMNTSFEQVIHHCKTNQRKNQDGTWITDEMEHSYIELHKKGIAHSAECWLDGELKGGLYGIMLEKVFCGESMFSLSPNCSKFAFIHFVNYLKTRSIELIDCQVHTNHLESLGAEMISRKEYLKYLD
jgi:leucyl/phenylalanyl-tRNA--protein transferase